MRPTSSQRGFTLIELLVVIAIIGLLSSVALASLTSARVKGRDARRQSDMHSFQQAIELYNNDNGGYPAAGAGPNYYLRDVSGLVPNYIKAMPVDPQYGGGGNDYRYLANSSGYVLLMYNERSATWCRIVYYSGTSSWWTSYPLCSSL